MPSNQSYFSKNKKLPIDKFFDRVLFDKKIGYYSSNHPFGNKGDFITSPGISNLFSEIIGIWIITVWHSFNKPKVFNIIELGPGDGSLMKILLEIFKRFPEFNNVVNIFMYEKSKLLRIKQKKNINNSRVRWINDFKKIKKGPAIFFGNEFFDSIPIKQFYRKNNLLYEKYYFLNKKNEINETFKKANVKDSAEIKSFKTLKELKFIEFPKLGLKELKKMIEIISKLNGGLLLIDYGYLNKNNNNTLQSVMRHKKNKILENLGKADITSLVNFNLLNEYFNKNNLKVKKIVTQKEFLEKMGILSRANIISKKMSFTEQANLYLRLKRLLNIKSMGNLFKVIFAFKSKKDNFLGFK